MTGAVRCSHLWQPHADSKRIWTVCGKCGEEQHVGTHAERMAETLAYIFRDLEKSA